MTDKPDLSTSANASADTPALPAPSAWQHAPHDTPDPDDARALFKSDLPPDLQFEPVPRRARRSNGFTPERQRAFIATLAATGSVTLSAKAIGCSRFAIDKLRNAAGAESFSAAWSAATARGARRVLDCMVENAINGTPEYLYANGQLVAERRRFNTRGQQWIVAHYLPDQFGVPGGLMHNRGGTADAQELRKQWEEEQRAAARKRGDEADAIYTQRVNAIRKGFKRSIAPDPLKRAAWEILCGPTDWEDCGVVPDYDGLPKGVTDNHHRPDMIVLAAALNVDTPDWGLLKAMEQGAFGPEKQAEALEAKRLRAGPP
jgi:hypothetical protein